MTSNNDRGLANKPIIVLIGLIASCIAIFVFVTGKEDIPEIFGISSPKTSTYKPPATAYSSPPIETPSPVPSPTPAITSSPLLSGNPSNWLPDSSEIPAYMHPRYSETTSNEYIAKDYDDPVAHFQRLRTWGRITGYTKEYEHNDGCELQTGFLELKLDAALFKTVDGARQALDWANSSSDYANGLEEYYQGLIYRVEPLGIGDAAYQLWFDGKAWWCEPSHTIRCVQITFRRYNAVGLVRLAAVKGTISEDDLLSQAIDLARLIDLRFVAEAKD
jgi:hypothetical protein